MRYFIEFSYFGARYHGWQNQPNALTVQSVLEDALSKLLRSNISVVGAGRTDAGVHAKQMYAHFDTDLLEDTTGLMYRLNAFLPGDIAVQRFVEVAPDTHARFHAIERSYEYWVVLEKDPFLTTKAYYVKHPLDVVKMNQAAALLLEHSDFECFSKSNTDVKTYICEVRAAHWEWRDNVLVFTISADRFLRNMVRAVVGTLLDVGSGKQSVESVQRIMESKDRAEAGASVPAKGLYLTAVIYPDKMLKVHG